MVRILLGSTDLYLFLLRLDPRLLMAAVKQ
jgi:hypothetical protein